MPPGVRALERLGARAGLSATDWAPIRGIRYLQENGTALEGRLPGEGGIGVRRTALAQALLDTARMAGVSVLARNAVRAHHRTDAAVYIDTDAGTYEAAVLVAADGLASPCGRRKDWTFRPRGRDAMGSASTSGCVPGRTAWRSTSPRGWRHTSHRRAPTGWESPFSGKTAASRRKSPGPPWCSASRRLATQLEGAQSDSTPRGAGPLRRRVLTRVRPRFVLLGDAAGYVDAITGEGLSLALVCAEALGRACRTWFAGVGSPRPSSRTSPPAAASTGATPGWPAASCLSPGTRGSAAASSPRLG